MVLALPAFANVVTATGNGSGTLPAFAQDLTAIPDLTEIVGTLDFLSGNFPNGVDIFAINIPNPHNFAAYTVDAGAFGIPDPELFLFDSTGLGVLTNDDISGGNTQACLPSLIAANPCPAPRPPGLGPLTPGVYYLAITRSANNPLSNSGYMFSPLLSTDVVGPDPTSGGLDPIVGWDNGVASSPDFDLVNYDIVLQFTPEPAVGLFTAAGLGILIFRRRFVS